MRLPSPAARMTAFMAAGPAPSFLSRSAPSRRSLAGSDRRAEGDQGGETLLSHPDDRLASPPHDALALKGWVLGAGVPLAVALLALIVALIWPTRSVVNGVLLEDSVRWASMRLAIVGPVAVAVLALAVWSHQLWSTRSPRAGLLALLILPLAIVGDMLRVTRTVGDLPFGSATTERRQGALGYRSEVLEGGRIEEMLLLWDTPIDFSWVFTLYGAVFFVALIATRRPDPRPVSTGVAITGGARGPTTFTVEGPRPRAPSAGPVNARPPPRP